MTTAETTRKERVRSALFSQPNSRVPTQINYSCAYGKILAEYVGVSVDLLPELLGNHILRLDITHKTKLNKGGDVRFDWWGVGFDTGAEGYFTAFSPLSETRDIDRYDWPDPHADGLFDGAKEALNSKGKEYFVIPNLGFALFERAWSLRGLEQFLIDMAADPGYTGALLDRIEDIQLVLIERYIKLGVDGGYFGDDYGAQRNLLFSPQMWRSLIKPRLARLFHPFKERNLPVIMHSDGQIQKILPDLIEIGLTTLNPIQPEVLDHKWLSDHYRGHLSFYGGISTQTVLPFGTVDEVKTAVFKVIDTLAPSGTGLIIAPSHRMMSDIPLKNAATLIELFHNLNG